MERRKEITGYWSPHLHTPNLVPNNYWCGCLCSSYGYEGYLNLQFKLELDQFMYVLDLTEELAFAGLLH